MPPNPAYIPIPEGNQAAASAMLPTPSPEDAILSSSAPARPPLSPTPSLPGSSTFARAQPYLYPSQNDSSSSISSSESLNTSIHYLQHPSSNEYSSSNNTSPSPPISPHVSLTMNNSTGYSTSSNHYLHHHAASAGHVAFSNNSPIPNENSPYPSNYSSLLPETHIQSQAPINNDSNKQSTAEPTTNPIMKRPSMVRFYSTPTLPCMSPTRQHFRLPNSQPRQIKETLNANLRVDETGKMLNQYLIKEEIGCGTFGTVWKVVDTTTNEHFAMKEYSKSSLRKHLRTELLSQRRAAMRRPAKDGCSGPRRPPPRGAPRVNASSEVDESSLGLIRREFAIAKKLDHPNIVTLEEVLDSPNGDSLYLILEWCAKGPLKPSITDHPELSHAMDVDKSEEEDEDEDEDRPIVPTSTLSEEQCRLYFRDMILGIEYLHSQGVIHRDIKAENLLLDEDDVLKIADFGVSELFNEQEGEKDIVTKTAGSPAYMAPELAVISNGTLMDLAVTKDIPTNMLSGRSADIWSMGVTLYYMIFGILPFRADNVMDLFTKIVIDDVDYLIDPDQLDPDLIDLFNRILCKSPQKRITMDELRQHPWVTLQDHDPLLSKEENIASSITPVTEEDLLSAIERIQGLGLGFEPEQAVAKLRRLHGWRGQTPSKRDSMTSSSTTTVNSGATSTASSVCNSRSPSVSPYLAPHENGAAITSALGLPGRVPSPPNTLSQLLDDNVSVHRLTRALEEVVQRNNSITINGVTVGNGKNHRRKVSSIYNTSFNISHSSSAAASTTGTMLAGHSINGVYLNPNVSSGCVDQNRQSMTSNNSPLQNDITPASCPMSTNHSNMSIISLNSSDGRPLALTNEMVATLTRGVSDLGFSNNIRDVSMTTNPTSENQNNLMTVLLSPQPQQPISHSMDLNVGRGTTIALGLEQYNADTHHRASNEDTVMTNSDSENVAYEDSQSSSFQVEPQNKTQDPQQEDKKSLSRKPSKTSRARALLGLSGITSMAKAH